MKNNVRFFSEFEALDLLIDNNVCKGCVAWDIRKGDLNVFNSGVLVMGTGGYGRAFKITSNAHENTGDGLGMILRNNLPLQDMEFVQFHPTGLQIEPLRKKAIVIDPLPGFEIIKDLAVDIDPFFEHLAKVKPYLINDEPPPDKESIQSPEEFKRISDPVACILCMSCTSSCPSFWSDPEYIGPAALYKAYRHIFDMRDKGIKYRVDVLDNKQGLWCCHIIFNYMDACPKKVKDNERDLTAET
ncbi:MAG: FAD-binding protein [Candidatus Hatepunaea meridiana]|nr:FAD-binding protein [Candidatus Hatepunaea meridiana]